MMKRPLSYPPQIRLRGYIVILMFLSWYPSLDDILNSRIDNNDHNKVDSIRVAVKGN